MRLYQRILVVLALAFFWYQNVQASACDSISLKLMEETWREFRAIHPFSFQTVGLKHYGDTCVFVMSEPNNWVKREDLEKLFSEYGGHLIVGCHPLGCDGALYDAIGCVKLGRILFSTFEKRLFYLLYGTSYKPYYTNLDNPSKHVYFSEINLNFNIARLDWISWNQKEEFICPNGEEVPFETLTTRNSLATNELYYSKKRGFIVWGIKKEVISPLDTTFISNARRFSLDTDLIVNSINAKNNVFLIARERETPITILPPLRVETLISLVQTSKMPLSVFISPDSAMCIDDSAKWITPININSELQDTELGNLMVMTDMMLKSWSENGLVKDSFINYPIPDHFLSDYGVAQELGYAPKYQWTFNSRMTGSLPPVFKTLTDSIIDSTLCVNYHEYFAKLNNIDLVRMAQYAFIHKAFQPLRTAKKSLELQKEEFPFVDDHLEETFFSGTEKWLQTPSITVSNCKWGYGGYVLQMPIIRRLPTALRSLPSRGISIPPYIENLAKRGLALPASLNAAIQREATAWQHLSNARTQQEIIDAKKNYNSAKRVLIKALEQYKPLTEPFINKRPFIVNPREALIHSDIDSNTRGYDSNLHNTSPEELLFSDSEKQELLDKSDKEKKIMEDLRLQLRQFNIPVKVIQNEQRIIIHVINVLKNYDKGCKYEWAA